MSLTLREMMDARRRDSDKMPGAPGRRLQFGTHLRSGYEHFDATGEDMFVVSGYASRFNVGYPMHDEFGPYTEIVAGWAFDKTLASDPDVAFLVNHAGLSMARTTNGTLALSADTAGLRVKAWLNPLRHDVQDLAAAIRDGTVNEMSFAFQPREGHWTEDFGTYIFTECDLDRGDVSVVNYGANPYTSVAEAREHSAGWWDAYLALRADYPELEVR